MFFFRSNMLHVTHRTSTKVWQVTLPKPIKNKWIDFEISWSASTGIAIYIDKVLIKKSSTFISKIITKKVVSSLIIGKSSTITASASANFIINSFDVWSTTREDLVAEGIVTKAGMYI